MDNVMIGKWAFIVGLLLAVIMAFVTFEYTAISLFVIGLIVGFLNIKDKEVQQYLIACIALITTAVAINALDVLAIVGEKVVVILTNFIAFVTASALVVAIKAVYSLSNTP